MNSANTIVFDNNAVISAAILKTSPTSKAFDFAIRNYTVVFSLDTLVELQEVLFRKKVDIYLSEAH